MLVVTVLLMHDAAHVALNKEPLDDKFVAKLRRRQLQSSEAVARKTLEIMRLIVATAVVSDVQALITMIKQVAAVLVAAQPHELAVGNMVRRVLSVVRDETGKDVTPKSLLPGGAVPLPQ